MCVLVYPGRLPDFAYSLLDFLERGSASLRGKRRETSGPVRRGGAGPHPRSPGPAGGGQPHPYEGLFPPQGCRTLKEHITQKNATRSIRNIFIEVTFSGGECPSARHLPEIICAHEMFREWSVS